MAPYMLLNSLQEMTDKTLDISNENNTVSIVYTLASILILI